MIHPGLETEIITEMSIEDCHKKLTAINNRIGIAYKLGRTDAIPQLNLLIDHYQSIINDKLDAELQEMIDKDPKLGRTVIDIEWPDPSDENDQEF
jgi:hypothetical protein